MQEISLSRELADQGYGYAEQCRMTRASELVRVRRGAYVRPPVEELDPRIAHLRLVEATVRQCSAEAVVSHISAAAIHGLPVWNEELERVQLTRDRSGGGKLRRYVQTHGLPLSEGDVVSVGGFAVTSLARTVLDLACTLSLAKAVPIGDAALRQALDPGQLGRLVDRATGRRGIGAARRAVSLLDGRSESPGESMSRVIFHQHRLPPPELQLCVHGDAGDLVGRADFGWPQQRTLGEFDGRVKYGRLLTPGQSVEDVLFAEKRREDALRDLGWQVVRWIWADLYAPDALVEWLGRAFAQARRIA